MFVAFRMAISVHTNHVCAFDNGNPSVLYIQIMFVAFRMTISVHTNHVCDNAAKKTLHSTEAEKVDVCGFYNGNPSIEYIPIMFVGFRMAIIHLSTYQSCLRRLEWQSFISVRTNHVCGF